MQAYEYNGVWFQVPVAVTMQYDENDLYCKYK